MKKYNWVGNDVFVAREMFRVDKVVVKANQKMMMWISLCFQSCAS